MYDRRNDYLRRRKKRYYSDYNYRYNDRRTRGNDFYYEDESNQSEYMRDIKEWTRRLMSKNRFNNIDEQQVINQARNMGIRFDRYTPEEFYAIYLAMVSDYQTISNDYNMYIKMARDFLEDDDVAVSPSEKVCIYLYNIVLGEE